MERAEVEEAEGVDDAPLVDVLAYEGESDEQIDEGDGEPGGDVAPVPEDGGGGGRGRGGGRGGGRARGGGGGSDEADAEVDAGPKPGQWHPWTHGSAQAAHTVEGGTGDYVRKLAFDKLVEEQDHMAAVAVDLMERSGSTNVVAYLLRHFFNPALMAMLTENLQPGRVRDHAMEDPTFLYRWLAVYCMLTSYRQGSTEIERANARAVAAAQSRPFYPIEEWLRPDEPNFAATARAFRAYPGNDLEIRSPLPTLASAGQLLKPFEQRHVQDVAPFVKSGCVGAYDDLLLSSKGETAMETRTSKAKSGGGAHGQQLDVLASSGGLVIAFVFAVLGVSTAEAAFYLFALVASMTAGLPSLVLEDKAYTRKFVIVISYLC